MNVFKRKSVYAAVLASLGTMAVAGSASAVQLSQDGTGQVLIYPYYTTRVSGVGEYNTFINVVNTTNDVKAVKVRFLEGKNSREVLDFNLYLSPRDVWAVAIKPSATGAGLNVVSTSDTSCVSSAGGLYASQTAGVSFNFTNNAYTGLSTDVGVTTGWDGADQTLDRTREGYVEIIEMGTIHNISLTSVPAYTGTGTAPSAVVAAPTAHGLAIATGVTHTALGVPANCAQVSTLAPSLTSGADFFPATGGLMGGASIINVTNGSDLAYDPVVLEDFNTATTGGTGATTIWSGPGTILPDMTSATPNSNVFYYHYAPVAAAWTTDVLANTWVVGEDAVSAVLLRNSVMNTYILDAATASKTDWVVTFPTKRHYISANNPATAVASATDPQGVVALSPFANAAAPTYFWNGFCNDISMQLWDREESTPVISTVEVSPPPPPGTATVNQLCWESNVITVANTAPAAFTDSLLGSHNGLVVTTANEHGWAALSMQDSVWHELPGSYNGETTTFTGLPVVGFMAHDFNAPVTINGGAATSSYGGNFNHRYSRAITGGLVTP